MVSTFGAKLGQVVHHLLKALGNVLAETPYRDINRPQGYQLIKAYTKDTFGQSASYGWPYINIATSENTQKMHVKFYADNDTRVRKYEWNFGDGSAVVKTINNEVEHVYDLGTKDDWLVYSGYLPIRGLTLSTGRWTNVSLTVTDIDGTVSTTTNYACVYEIDAVQDDNYWQVIDEIPNSGGAPVYQATISSGDQIQTVKF